MLLCLQVLLLQSVFQHQSGSWPRLWMIVDAIRNRNYLYGYDIYMRLAIGATSHIFHSVIFLASCCSDLSCCTCC
jgi:hypothetical protein